MGRDKALVGVGGVPMARLVADALAGAGCRPVIAIGGDAATRAAIGLEVVADEHPGEGPLGGIATALAATGRPTIVVACDLPRLRARDLALLIAALGDVTEDGPGGDAVDVVQAVDGRGGAMPLCALWTPRAGAAARAAFDVGERAVRPVLARLRVREVALDGAAVVNVNTAADLAGLGG